MKTETIQEIKIDIWDLIIELIGRFILLAFIFYLIGVNPPTQLTGTANVIILLGILLWVINPIPKAIKTLKYTTQK